MENPITMSSFPSHGNIFKIFKRVAVTEADVERAFSVHKLIHYRLCANVSSERLQDQLFIRYNAKRMFGQSLLSPDDIEADVLENK